jgi:hypothetical protein
VDLLPGLRPEDMQTYEKEKKKRRAPREDLSTLTAEGKKVEGRKGPSIQPPRAEARRGQDASLGGGRGHDAGLSFGAS